MSETYKTNSVMEPQAGKAAMPIWILVMAIVTFFAGGMYFDAYGGWFNPQVYAPYHSVKEVTLYQPITGDSWKSLGVVKYEASCAVCHGSDGNGKPGVAPPFVGSEWVLTENVGQLIRIPLHGLNGPIKVKNVEYNLNMPAIALNDEELSAVLSHMRSSWGNKAPRILPEKVAEVRAATASRKIQWTSAELEKVQ